jgi:hypothetical protein
MLCFLDGVIRLLVGDPLQTGGKNFGRGLKNREELEARIKPAHCYVG